MQVNHIKCPNCGHQFDVEEALSRKLEAHFKKEYEQKIAAQAAVFNNERKQLEEAKKLFEARKEQENKLFNERLNKKLEEEKTALAQKAKEQVEAELMALKSENEARKEENKRLKSKEIDLLQKEAKLREKQEELALELEKQLLEKQSAIEEKARQKERETFELERVKLLKQIDDNKKLAEEMKRKAEQGSMQLQGEVQELALEELLRSNYPFDEIEEVPKGITGADCIQTVINAQQQACGKIVYESKRTKNFANDWVEKLKQDQVNCKADIAVLVTQAMPADMERFGEKNGVWICGFHEVKSLSLVLREMLLKINTAQLSQENKGEKMELLYDYLTSNEFVQNINRIVENYDNMINQLNSEKKAMFKIWAAREKQIWTVQETISTLFGSIKGIAGNSLANASSLELPEPDFE